MAQLRQFYGRTGVPLRLDREPGAPAVTWQSHRARLRTWLDAVPDSKWGGPTRCALWDMTALVRHLVSGSQFLGYTLHKANRGVATEVLRGFDTQLTARTDAERFGGLTPATARDLLASKDASVAAEFVGAGQGGWSAMAEAPGPSAPAAERRKAASLAPQLSVPELPAARNIRIGGRSAISPGGGHYLGRTL